MSTLTWRQSRLVQPVLVCLSLSVASCDSFLDVTCALVPIPSVVAEVRDQAGRPAANGATLTIRKGSFVAEGLGFGKAALEVSAGQNLPGTFTATVTKPWHRGAVVRNVEVPGGPCGPEQPARINVSIELKPDAPAVRQVVVPPFAFNLGDGNVTTAVQAFVEADSSVSQEARWSTRDSLVVRITPEGTMTSVCRDSSDSTYVVASAVADPSVKDSVRVNVSATTVGSDRCP